MERASFWSTQDTSRLAKFFYVKGEFLQEPVDHLASHSSLGSSFRDVAVEKSFLVKLLSRHKGFSRID